jgi:transcriptional antiterminator RfaH
MEKNGQTISGWFIVSTKPNKELVLKQSFDRMGILNYLPLFLKEKKKNKEKIKVVSPLFTGYIFARFDVMENYHKIRYTRGVKSILGNQQYVFSLSNEKIEDMKSREKGGYITLIQKPKSFKKGDRVLIDEGDFDGWEGIFYEEMSDKQRAVIMLTSVSFSNKLIIPKKFLVYN